MANLARGFAFLILVISLCLFQTEASRPSQFITITASPAPAPATSEISFPPAGSTPASAPAPATGELSFPPVLAPEISFPPVSSLAPAAAPLGDVSPAPLESDTGYGLYGFQTEENPSTESFSESRTENSFDGNYNNGGYSQRHFNKHNGYNVPDRQGISDTRFVDNGKYYYNANNENSYDNRYSEMYYDKGNSFDMPDRQGASDTRFMENGKYYDDVNNENYRQNEYEPMRGNEGYDGNFKYEFDSMEEYDKRHGFPQHGYPQTQSWEEQP